MLIYYKMDFYNMFLEIKEYVIESIAKSIIKTVRTDSDGNYQPLYKDSIKNAQERQTTHKEIEEK